MTHKKFGLMIGIAVLLLLVLAACQPQTVEVPVEVTRIVTETVVEEGQQVEVTRIVTETVVETVVETVEVPAEEEAMTGEFIAPDPETYTFLTFGDVDTLDPNLAYDTASGAVILNVMEPLIWYNGPDPTTYVPVLATEVPSLDNGLISEDGLTYTFNIREGVTFHEGGTLEPHDVAYTFQRGLLQSSPDGPQWLLVEPIMGYNNCYDISEGIDPECGIAGDRDALLSTATPEQLVETCEAVQAAIVADDDAGTVTFNLAMPWGPFLATIAQTWGTVMDMEWAVENGAWDGSCDTWQNYYAAVSENDELSGIINGTGPYKLDNWTPGEGWVMVANENYWRTDADPVWEGGPAGQPRIKTVVNRLVDEWGTRFAALQAGDAETVSVPAGNRPQVDQFVGEFCDYKTGECTPNEENPNGPLRKWGGLPSVSRTDVFMTFEVAPDSPYIGSGQLDGNGIPPNFFSDINVRRAMNYCFDYEAYIADAQNGEGVRNNGPIIKDMLGYNEDGPMYEFDLAKCEEELAQAWDGQLPETGFRFQIAYNTGNVSRQTVGEILQANLRSINPDYKVEIVGLPWPTFLRSFRASQVPMIASGWLEDIHDPHNWVQPFTIGTYAGRQNLPDDIKAQFTELVNAGVASADPAEREQIYYELQQLHHDMAIQITLSQIAGARYEQRWVQDWYFNPALFGQYPYAYSLNAGE
ncbi:MAG TPA: ABC transporter substrate-binding protein [Anaerolineae bacterium]|nr:ABC transporter substrate-binding protein [Anaerolineae bacterium]HIP70559.1 ABC transporter substrate-binding protein [Anaerolineae bacterium]